GGKDEVDVRVDQAGQDRAAGEIVPQGAASLWSGKTPGEGLDVLALDANHGLRQTGTIRTVEEPIRADEERSHDSSWETPTRAYAPSLLLLEYSFPQAGGWRGDRGQET